ncbi:tuberoinfundibular peptide of 39 residues [Latimeria chalumnae]|uniref:tuberoinfundibular peptide of 39 residues n=1 Tax=Latimeria chalumnae TaxID=7897 RepID=UPI00313B7423
MIPAGVSLRVVILLLGCYTFLSFGAILPSLRNVDSSIARPWRGNFFTNSGSTKDVGELLPRLSTWDLQFPIITLHDWSIKLMSSGSAPKGTPTKPANRKSHHQPISRRDWLPSNLIATGRKLGHSLVIGKEAGLSRAALGRSWPSSWSEGEEEEKRGVVVAADDDAFREKIKMMTSIERQKWLNSYMQKLLVFNSK